MDLKIVVIGAGSVVFGLSSIKDAFAAKELWGSRLVFVDLDELAVKRMARAAERINTELDAGFKIEWTTDRRSALVGADFVILSVAIDRMPLWKKDFEIPKKYGIRHVLGENQGPGAVFHTMRNIALVMPIYRDIEDICPNALVLNFTNPESRICMAALKYTKVQTVGLCHQIGVGIRIVSTILGRNSVNLDVKAWGLNHLTWMHDIRDRSTGEDLYPVFKEKEQDFDSTYEPLSRYIYHKFGLFPTSGDGHLGEFFPFAHEMMSTRGYDFDGYEKRRKEGIRIVEGINDGSVPIDEHLLSKSGERAFDIIRGIVTNSNEVIESANLPNEGYITNLPEDAIVEVPVVVNGFGVRGISVGSLPSGISALCQAQVNVQRLAVDAGYHGNAELALQALLIDPNVPSAEAAERLFAELYEHNRPYLPQFEQGVTL